MEVSLHIFFNVDNIGLSGYITRYRKTLLKSSTLLWDGNDWIWTNGFLKRFHPKNFFTVSEKKGQLLVYEMDTFSFETSIQLKVQLLYYYVLCYIN